MSGEALVIFCRRMGNFSVRLILLLTSLLEPSSCPFLVCLYGVFVLFERAESPFLAFQCL